MALLEHCRVLDFSDHRGLITGRMLADLGADVVQVEPPGGSSARRAEPLGPSGSYFWATYAANKRGVCLDPADPASRPVLDALIAHADVLIESAPPGTMDSLGLGYDSLRLRNPRLVYVSVTAFGSEGPKAGYADSDLVVWAAGGPLHPHRDAGRPPVRISIPQAFLHAGADAADGALLALLARERTGRGQHVDVSAQASLGTATLGRVLAHAVGDAAPEWERLVDGPGRRLDQSGSGSGTDPALKKWRCADGLVEFHLTVGTASGAFTTAFFRWMASENPQYGRFADIDWRTVPRLHETGEFTSDDMDDARAAVAAFLATKTKAEVLDAARTHRLLCVPIYDTGDVRRSAQFAARRFLTELTGADGHTTVLPGPFAQVRGPGQDPAFRIVRAAPALGEHQDEVVRDWLGAAADTVHHDMERAS